MSPSSSTQMKCVGISCAPTQNLKHNALERAAAEKTMLGAATHLQSPAAPAWHHDRPWPGKSTLAVEASDEKASAPNLDEPGWFHAEATPKHASAVWGLWAKYTWDTQGTSYCRAPLNHGDGPYVIPRASRSAKVAPSPRKSGTLIPYEAHASSTN